MARISTYLNRVVPLINIYGEEDHWPVLRMAASSEKRSRIVSGSYQPTEDEAYFSDMYGILGTIQEICGIHQDVYDALQWLAIAMPWIWATRESLISAKRKWRSVGRYMDHDLHNDYSLMIGAASAAVDPQTGKSTVIFGQHDGLIANKHSQMPEHKGLSVRNITVKGVNHMEMSGHWRVKEALTIILNANGRNYDSAFNQTMP